MRIDPLAGALALLATAVSTHAHAQTAPPASGTTWTTTTTPAEPSGTAVVEPPPGPAPGAAVQSGAIAHYERGRVYYAAGRYRSAVLELERAIRLDPNGYNLYFDLGLVYERIGHVEEALTAYRRYLARVQDPSEHERAERIVRRLEGARAELGDLEFHRGRADVLFWGVAAASLTLLVGGGVVLFSAVRADAHADDVRRMGGDAMMLQGALDSASAQHVIADVAIFTGVGLGLGAALLYALRGAESRNPPLCLTASAGPGGAALRLSF